MPAENETKVCFFLLRSGSTSDKDAPQRMQCAPLPGSWCSARPTAFPGIDALFPMDLGLVASNLEGSRVSPRCKDQPHRAEKKKKGNLHCRDARHMRRAETASATKALKASLYQAGFHNGRSFFKVRFDENNNPRSQGFGFARRGSHIVTRIVQTISPRHGHYWVIMH